MKMHLKFGRLMLAALLLSGAAYAGSQSPDAQKPEAQSPGAQPVGAVRGSGPGSAQTVELVREAVANLSDQNLAAHRFTYFELSHNENRDEKGKLKNKISRLIETIYLADLPYERLVEVDGKPLEGKALAEEQARYDRAVQDRTALDATARARFDKQHMVSAAVPYPLLTTRFQLTDLRQETLAGRVAHVIDAVPLPSSDPAQPAQSRHIRLWIAPTGAGSPPMLLRTDFDYLADDGEVLRGSTGSITYTIIDGIPLPEQKELHTRVRVQGKVYQVDIERSYSRYRKFGSTVRILPPDNDQPPPKL